MLSHKVEEVIKSTRAGRKVCLIVFVHADVDLPALKKIKDVRLRSEKLDTAYRVAKQPILDTFSSYADFDVIDKLEGTPQLVVSGPAKAWRKLLSDRPTFASSPDVEVLANDVRWSV